MASNSRLLQSIASVQLELEKLAATVAEIQDVQPHAGKINLYASAFLLQSFYTGSEKVLKRCLKMVGCTLPAGDNWHFELLNLAAQENESVHPAVISASTRNRLDELRAFRHVARTHYGLDLDVARIEPLLDGLPELWTALRAEVEAFLQFARQRDQ